MDKPSLTVWIDPKTQVFKVDFNPQELAPAEYGLMLASIVMHLAKMFVAANPRTSEEELVKEIQRGISIGLQQMRDVELPSRAH